MAISIMILETKYKTIFCNLEAERGCRGMDTLGLLGGKWVCAEGKLKPISSGCITGTSSVEQGHQADGRKAVHSPCSGHMHSQLAHVQALHASVRCATTCKAPKYVMLNCSASANTCNLCFVCHTAAFHLQFSGYCYCYCWHSVAVA